MTNNKTIFNKRNSQQQIIKEPINLKKILWMINYESEMQIKADKDHDHMIKV